MTAATQAEVAQRRARDARDGRFGCRSAPGRTCDCVRQENFGRGLVSRSCVKDEAWREAVVRNWHVQ